MYLLGGTIYDGALYTKYIDNQVIRKYRRNDPKNNLRQIRKGMNEEGSDHYTYPGMVSVLCGSFVLLFVEY